MDSKDTQDSGLLEGRSTLLIDSASATARRRRRETRLVKMGLNFGHQSGLKHTGFRPVHSNSIRIFDDDDDDRASRSVLAGTTSSFSDVRDKANHNLVRSRSFPPERWQTSKYIFKISKLGGGTAKHGQRYSVTVVGDEQCGDFVKLSSKFSSPSSLSISSVNVPSSRPDLSEGHLSLPQLQDHKKESCKDFASPVTVKDVEKCVQKEEIAMPSLQLQATSMETLHVDNNVCVTGKTVVVEGKSTMNCEAAALEYVSVNPGKCPPYAKVLVCGRRREMEDSAIVAPSFAKVSLGGKPNNLHFFGVYDGHGGSQASNHCAERLHQVLAEEIESSQLVGDGNNDSEWQKVMTSTFLKLDVEVGGVCPFGVCDDGSTSASCCAGSIAPENVGTTAVVAVVSSTQIILANCGDSRAVLSRGGKVIPLSMDHKPERADETSRIEAAGGCVIEWKGFRVGALLAVSRSIGDRYLKRYVISQPDVVCLPRTQEDECLILASDGLWDMIENEMACNVARRCLASAHRRRKHRRTTSCGEDLASASIAATLVKLAYGRGSEDNISVLVIDLGVETQT